MSIVALIIALILSLLGLAGTILPVLPGAPLIWLGMLIYGIFTRFQTLGFPFFFWQGVAVLITFLIDYVGTAYGAKRYGGTLAAVIGATAGLLIGPFVLGPAGIIIGPFAGAFIWEVVKGRHPQNALRAAFGTLAGMVGATLLKFLIEIIMIMWFLWVVLAR